MCHVPCAIDPTYEMSGPIAACRSNRRREPQRTPTGQKTRLNRRPTYTPYRHWLPAMFSPLKGPPVSEALGH